MKRSFRVPRKKTRILKRGIPNLYITDILKWADAHFAKHGKWPGVYSGHIPGTVQETWKKIQNALVFGYRGLRPGMSIAKLLMQHRGARHLNYLPKLTEQQILKWADAHHARTGDWPHKDSGSIPNTRGEKWSAVQYALRKGVRGLPGGSTLADLLQAHRGVRNNLGLPPLTIKQILAWADAYHGRMGKWPDMHSGPIAEAPEETWAKVNRALMQAGRGLRSKTSLAEFLVKHRGAKKHTHAPRLTVAKIRRWLLAHHRRTGTWPSSESGPVHEAPGESWQGVNQALFSGYRGLPGGSSLAKIKVKLHKGK